MGVAELTKNSMREVEFKTTTRNPTGKAVEAREPYGEGKFLQ